MLIYVYHITRVLVLLKLKLFMDHRHFIVYRRIKMVKFY